MILKDHIDHVLTDIQLKIITIRIAPGHFFFYKILVKVVERWVWSLSYDSPTLLFDEIWPFDVVQKNPEVIVQFKGGLVSRNVKNWELCIT